MNKTIEEKDFTELVYKAVPKVYEREAPKCGGLLEKVTKKLKFWLVNKLKQVS